MGEEDYAVRAAREWFSPVQAEFGIFAKERHRTAFEDSVQMLAAIIRKHVAENIDEINSSLQG